MLTCHNFEKLYITSTIILLQLIIMLMMVLIVITIVIIIYNYKTIVLSYWFSTLAVTVLEIIRKRNNPEYNIKWPSIVTDQTTVGTILLSVSCTSLYNDY